MNRHTNLFSQIVCGITITLFCGITSGCTFGEDAGEPPVDYAQFAHLRTLIGHTLQVFSVAITHDGQNIVSGSGDSTIKVWGLP